MRRIPLTAAPLSMLFEPELAFLRYVRLGDREVVRGIFAAVRDHDWNTIPFTVSDLQCDRAEDRFALTFVANCAHETIRFRWRGEITGTRDGAVRYAFSGEALNTFARNRIGLCVLHPIEPCAGRTCRVEHANGLVTEGTFPEWISPHQPFKNIRSITHQVQPGVEAQVSFHGEVFEMEDQRNWTDASYKTYGTPLELPFPVTIEARTRVDQSVTVELKGDTEARVPRSPAIATAVVYRICIENERRRKLPSIGLSMATVEESPSEAVVSRLREIRADHLRVDLYLDDERWSEHAGAAAELAGWIGAKLEVALFVVDGGGSQLQACLGRFEGIRERIARWLVFDPSAKATPPALVESATRTLRQFDPAIPIVVGTNAYFAELNRNRPPVPDQGQICYSINPQVHAFDKLSLSETLGAQRWTVDTARETFGCPVVVSPITLRPRLNPNATSTPAEAAAMPEPETDPRQSSGFAAAWTAGALAKLARHPGVASLTFFETFGPRGVMDASGSPYAVFDVFQSLRGADTIYEVTSSHPLEIAALAVTYADGDRGLVMANMSDEARTVSVSWGDGEEFEVDVEAESIRRVAGKDLP